MKIIALIVITLLLTGSAQSQQPKSPPRQKPPASEDDVVRIDLNLIQVDAVVTDKHGRQVTNLTAQDFSIIENGKPHVADYCTYVSLTDKENNSDSPPGPPSATELGRTFVFLVDNPRIELAFSNAGVSGSYSGSVSFLRRAIRGSIEAEKLLSSFIDKELGPRDLVAIADTEVDLGVLSSFTNDRAALHQAIREIRNNSTNGRTPIIRITSINGDLSLGDLAKQNLRVMETISNVIRQLETLPGRKVITLLSRGMLFQPQLPGADVVIDRMKTLIDEANRARVSIYALSPAGVGNFGGETLQNLDGLIHLARETGGRAIYNTNDTRVGFAEVVEKNRGYYLLAYKSEPDTHARPHSLKVRLNRDDLRVEARTTAYARTTPPSLIETLTSAIDSPLRQTAIPLEVVPTFVTSGATRGHISLVIKVGLSESDLVNTNEITKAKFDLALRVTGPDGRLLPPSIHQLTFTASAPERNHVLEDGLSTHLKIPVDTPGFYRISVAVQSKQTKEFGSTTAFIEAKGKR